MGTRNLSNLKQEKGEQVILLALEMERTDTPSNDGLLLLGFGALISLISTCRKH